MALDSTIFWGFSKEIAFLSRRKWGKFPRAGSRHINNPLPVAVLPDFWLLLATFRMDLNPNVAHPAISQ
jgi:hypothetical protein